jgi:3-hydroxybutyryl-CoA dehydratase
MPPTLFTALRSGTLFGYTSNKKAGFGLGDWQMSYTAHHLFFDDVDVGQEWESAARTITEADIVNFAGISGDFNPIHVDHEFARKSQFQQPIAHGLLVQSIASGLAVVTPPMRTVALLSIREWYFRAPVFIGDTIRVRTKVLDKELRGKGRRGAITWQRQIMNQSDKIVQEGVAVSLVEGRSPDEEIVI